MTPPTHAFVGYSADGTPVELIVDDGRPDTDREAIEHLRAGGRIERMTLEQARQVRLYERPAP